MLDPERVFTAVVVTILMINVAKGSPFGFYSDLSSEQTNQPSESGDPLSEHSSQPSEGGDPLSEPTSQPSESSTQLIGGSREEYDSSTPHHDYRSHITTETKDLPEKDIFINFLSSLEKKRDGLKSFISKSFDFRQFSEYDKLILTFIYSIRGGGGLFRDVTILLLRGVKPTDRDRFKEALRNRFLIPDSDIFNTFEYLNSESDERLSLPEYVVASLHDFLEVTSMENFGKTYLELGVERGYFKAVMTLSAKGSTAVDSNGDTLLHLLAASGNLKALRTLLEADLVPIDTMNAEGKTALYVAASNEHDEVVELLKSKGSEVDRRSRDGETQLYIAAREGNVKALAGLVRAGADTNIADEDGFTPLYVAVRFGRKEAIALLLRSGADRDAEWRGNKLIHLAVRYNHTHAVRNLLDLGQSVESPDSKNFRPLHWAARSGLPGMVQLLLDRGAQVDSLTVFQRTPLHEAAFWSQFDCVDILIRHGANVNFQDEGGKKPVDMAIMNDHTAMKALLTSIANRNV